MIAATISAVLAYARTAGNRTSRRRILLTEALDCAEPVRDGREGRVTPSTSGFSLEGGDIETAEILCLERPRRQAESAHAGIGS